MRSCARRAPSRAWSGIRARRIPCQICRRPAIRLRLRPSDSAARRFLIAAIGVAALPACRGSVKAAVELRSPTACCIAAISASFVDRRRPVPRLGAGFGDQLVDRVDDRLHLAGGRTSRRRASRLPTASSASDSTISTAFVGAGDDELELGVVELGGGRVQQVLAVRCSRRVAAPIGPSNGMPDSASAAEAPISAGMSAVDFRVQRQHAWR